MQAWGFTVRGEGSETLEIDIYDIVGGGFFFGGVTAQSVRRMLKAQSSAKLIKLRINSEGGDVFDGFAIYNLLNEHPARVEVDIDALAASVASVIAMAADEIRIASNAWVMIHNAWGVARGESDDLHRWGDVLRKMSEQSAEIYAARTGMALAEVQELMDAETWMPAEEALKHGFVDKVIPAKKSNAKAAARAFACMAVDDYRNVPSAVRELVQQGRAQRPQQSNPEPGAPENPRTGEEIDDMNDDDKKNHGVLQALLVMLGVTAVAEAAPRVATLLKLEAATGKTGDEALGVALAHKRSHGELEAANVVIAELRAKTDGNELDAAIAKAKAESRHTPARETEVRELLKSGDIKLAGAKAMVGTWGVISALAAAKDGAKASVENAAVAGADLRHNGKTYAEMNSSERKKLHSDNEELFHAMRKQAVDAGLV